MCDDDECQYLLRLPLLFIFSISILRVLAVPIAEGAQEIIIVIYDPNQTKVFQNHYFYFMIK